MVGGMHRSGSKKRVYKRVPSGKSVLTFRAKKTGKPTCPSGRELPGTVRGSKAVMSKYTKTQRRPSRPYGGVFSSPVMRDVMLQKVQSQFSSPSQPEDKIIVPGAVCMKIAGRDAGKLCVVTEVLDNKFVKIDGYTRPRKVNVSHIEPVGKTIDVKKGMKSEDIQAALQ